MNELEIQSDGTTVTAHTGMVWITDPQSEDRVEQPDLALADVLNS